MDVFAQKRYMAWTIVFLLILNVATLSLIWLKEIRKPPRPHEPPRRPEGGVPRFLRDELKFSDAQVREYDELRSESEERTRVLRDEIRRLRRSLAEEVFREDPDTAKAAQVARMIGEKQAELENVTFMHFMDLRTLCGEEQRRKLHALIDEFFRRTRPDRVGRRPPPPDRGRDEGAPRDRPANSLPPPRRDSER